MFSSGTQTTMQFALVEPDEGDDHRVFVDGVPDAESGLSGAKRVGLSRCFTCQCKSLG